MPVKVNSFMGKLGWNARRYFPRLASAAYLKWQFMTRGKGQQEYVDWFLAQPEVPMPMVVNIETVNRCNSTCAFCTANKNAEKRPFMMMPEEMYYSIIDQLAEWGFKGHLTLYGNNEPLLDPRIVDFHKYAREKLPECFIFMSTNGLLLTLDKVREVQPYVNQIIINNYSNDFKLHDNLQEIVDYMKANPSEFEDLDVQVQMRYLQEVLTNRAGSAPNKEGTDKVFTDTCLLPFTDMWIVPSGNVGLCCCDNFEVTNYGKVQEVKIRETWESEGLQNVRKLIAQGRDKYPFCAHCDFIDAGFRREMCAKVLEEGVEAAHKIGGQESMKLLHKKK